MFLFVQVEGVDKVKPNENIYTPYGTYGDNGEYKYTKPLNGDNYTAPLDKSITFSSSSNSPWGQQNSGTYFLYQWNGSPTPLEPWKGHAVIGPEPVLMGGIANANEQVTNIAIAADTRGYNTETEAYPKAHGQNWGASGGYSNIMPFYEFPLNGIILTINDISIDEIYCNPSDDSEGVWLYLNRTNFYSLSEFESFINRTDTTTHRPCIYRQKGQAVFRCRYFQGLHIIKSNYSPLLIYLFEKTYKYLWVHTLYLYQMAIHLFYKQEVCFEYQQEKNIDTY